MVFAFARSTLLNSTPTTSTPSRSKTTLAAAHRCSSTSTSGRRRSASTLPPRPAFSATNSAEAAPKAYPPIGCTNDTGQSVVTPRSNTTTVTPLWHACSTGGQPGRRARRDDQHIAFLGLQLRQVRDLLVVLVLGINDGELTDLRMQLRLGLHRGQAGHPPRVACRGVGEAHVPLGTGLGVLAGVHHGRLDHLQPWGGRVALGSDPALSHLAVEIGLDKVLRLAGTGGGALHHHDWWLGSGRLG